MPTVDFPKRATCRCNLPGLAPKRDEGGRRSVRGSTSRNTGVRIPPSYGGRTNARNAQSRSDHLDLGSPADRKGQGRARKSQDRPGIRRSLQIQPPCNQNGCRVNKFLCTFVTFGSKLKSIKCIDIQHKDTQHPPERQRQFKRKRRPSASELVVTPMPSEPMTSKPRDSGQHPSEALAFPGRSVPRGHSVRRRSSNAAPMF